MFERRILRGLMLAMGLALVVALVLPAVAMADQRMRPKGPMTPVTKATIPGDPLTIHAASDLSIQVVYKGRGGQVYPPGAVLADSGGFAWIMPPLGATNAVPQVYGPEFVKHTGGSKATPVLPWSPVSPPSLTGSGTASDPWWVNTVVQGQAVRVYQWVRYVNGDECFTVSYIVNNLINTDDPITFFQAADLYVDGDDNAYGFYDPASGAVGGWNKAMDFLEYLVPLTSANGLPMPAADHYQEAHYSTIWSNIADGVTGFNDTIRAYPDWHDSGCGLQWDMTFPGVDPYDPPPPGNFVELGADWCFFQEEAPEFVPEPGSVMLLASGLMGLAGYAGLRKWRG